MQYSDARKNIKSGDVLFFTCDKVRSFSDLKDKIIMWWTKSKYYHTAIAWVIDGRVFMLEAVPGGVRMFPLSKELPVDWVSVPKYWNKKIAEWSISHLGDPYSQKDCALEFFKILKNGSNAEWQCAEFAGYILKMGGVFDDYDAVPQGIFEKLMEKGLKVETLV
jgi:uncharacterized protein YycO